jgi:hypothetical protein
VVNADSTNWIEFPTNAGVLDNGTEFVGVALVSVNNASAASGAILKIGADAAWGPGFGFGNTNFENTGTKLVALSESIAWSVSGSDAIINGLNVVTFGQYLHTGGYEPCLSYRNHSVSSQPEIAPIYLSDYTQIVNRLRINGYVASRGLTGVVHAMAIYRVYSTQITYPSKRDRLITNQLLSLSGLPLTNTKELFTPRPIILPAYTAQSKLMGTVTLPSEQKLTPISGNSIVTESARLISGLAVEANNTGSPPYADYSYTCSKHDNRIL